jgi:hypothetical protein
MCFRETPAPPRPPAMLMPRLLAPLATENACRVVSLAEIRPHFYLRKRLLFRFLRSQTPRPTPTPPFTCPHLQLALALFGGGDQGCLCGLECGHPLGGLGLRASTNGPLRRAAHGDCASVMALQLNGRVGLNFNRVQLRRLAASMSGAKRGLPLPQPRTITPPLSTFPGAPKMRSAEQKQIIQSRSPKYTQSGHTAHLGVVVEGKRGPAQDEPFSPPSHSPPKAPRLYRSLFEPTRAPIKSVHGKGA